MAVEQRVASLANADTVFCIEQGRGAIVLFSQRTLSKNKIQFREDLIVILYFGNMLSSLIAEAGKNGFYFILLFQVKFFQIIIQFYHCHGFYK